MMAPITANYGDTLRSDTIEGQILELCLLHDIWQRDAAKNPNTNNRVTWSITGANPSISGQLSFKVAPTSNSTGQIVMSIVEYLSTTGFVNTNNLIKSTVPSSYLVELLFYAQSLESNSAKNPTGANGVTVSFDSDTNTCTGSFTLDLYPMTSVTDGNAQFSAKAYLL